MDSKKWDLDQPLHVAGVGISGPCYPVVGGYCRFCAPERAKKESIAAKLRQLGDGVDATKAISKDSQSIVAIKALLRVMSREDLLNALKLGVEELEKRE